MVTIVGNRLNSANKKVLDRMNKMDMEFIKRETVSQIEQGAEFIEINAASLLHNEMHFLKTALPLVENCGAKVMLISENTDCLLEALKIAKKEIIIGPVEYNPSKIDCLIDAMKAKNTKIIAQIREKDNCDGYFPEKSLYIAQQYIAYLFDHGIRGQDILLDPLVRPLEEDFCSGKIFLNTIELFKLDFPLVKTMANISQFSEGLPKRHLITSYFICLALSKGLDYIVTNVLDQSISESVIATFSIIGKDKNLQSYLRYCKNHKDKDKKTKGSCDERPEYKRNSH